MRGESALLLWHDYGSSDTPAFHEWYNRRHIPERVPALPGFLRARRFEAVEGGPRFVALYDLASADALRTPQYRSLIENLDPETRHFVPQFENVSKTILSVQARAEYGEGAALAAFGFDADASLLPKAACCESLGRLAAREGIVAAHLLKLDADAMAASTPTRPGDLALPFVLLVEAAGERHVAQLTCEDAMGLPAGSVKRLRSGVFRLLFASLLHR